jgi:alkanesulfonate monooxygenase SsuD/methylene tetrahydromethanopterin reductase-like flavin-dependent oxidoreductase (luciferase family)
MIPDADPDLIAEWAMRAESGPFGSLATGELITSQAYDPFVALSVAAAVTRKINLFTNVLVLPLHNAGLVAKQAASLDRISGGRLWLGLGVGAKKPSLSHRAGEAPPDADLPDFTAAPASPVGRYARFADQIEFMQRIWRGEPVTESGLRVGPSPATQGGPLLLIGGYTRRLLAESVTWAGGLTTFGLAPDLDRMARDFRIFREAWQGANRKGEPRLIATHFYALGPNAESGTRNYIARHYTHLDAAQQALFAEAITPKDETTLGRVFQGLADAGASDVVPIPMLAALDQVDRLADVLGPLATV